MNGGMWVSVLKTGTKIRPPTPRAKIILRWFLVNADTSLTFRFCSLSNFPFSERLRMSAGITMDTSDGMNISVSTPCVVITPLIHSMMVVTSPMGEKAPPELAAMMIRPA